MTRPVCKHFTYVGGTQIVEHKSGAKIILPTTPDPKSFVAAIKASNESHEEFGDCMHCRNRQAGG